MQRTCHMWILLIVIYLSVCYPLSHHSHHNYKDIPRCATELIDIPPFCENPFANGTLNREAKWLQDIPPCGCTECDIPDIVNKYQSMLERGLAPPKILNCHIYILANGTGSPLVDPTAALQNIDMVNKALSPFNISLQASVTIYKDNFLYSRFVVPFCRPIDIGNGVCDPLCNISITGFDGGECGAYIPPAPCSNKSNGVCDEDCNYLQYNWDNGDCCQPSIASYHCRDPRSPLKMWVSEKQMSINVGATGESSFNMYIAQYADCYYCGASSNFPWWYDFAEPSQQGSISFIKQLELGGWR